MLLFAIFQCTFTYGQKKRMTDAEFNNPKVACYVNDTFVKNFIGIDMKAAPGDKMIKENLKEPIVINNNEYSGKVTIKRDNETEFITLDEIRKLYCPETVQPVVYMINEYFITKDIASYKLDKNYINTCEVLLNSDFEILKGEIPFSIIRIFTKNDDKSVRLR